MTDLTYYRVHAEHIALMEPQPGQEWERGFMLLPEVEPFIWQSTGLSVFQKNRCIACAGLAPLPTGGAELWAVLSKQAGPYMLPLARKTLGCLKLSPTATVYAHVRKGFEPGHRLVKLLGFDFAETVAGCFNGEDGLKYVRGRT